MRRLLVIGSGGVGKSTLSTELGRRLGLPVIHLDALYWQPGWVAPSPEAWKQIVAELTRRECWVMDGNYRGTMEERLQSCDTVVFLALSRFVCLYRVVKRALIFYGKGRPDMAPGCPEQVPSREFLWWIWTYPRLEMPKIMDLLRRYEGEKTIVVLRSLVDVERFLSTIEHRTTG